ncbi:hypothetical protein BSKO_05119 [Bryopsis sp. KO-2023]|nr:hypothetical protein BSKO_05119 [Bryopsis sp. KO-2023]
MAPDDTSWGLILLLAISCLNGFAWLTRRRKISSVLSVAKEISSEVRRLRGEADLLNQPEDFVKRARLQRQANGKEKELDLVWKDMQGYHLTMPPRLSKSLKIVVGAVGIASVWGLPVVRLPFPIPLPTIRFPHRYPFHGAECVAIIPWLVLSDRASQAIWEAVFPINVGKSDLGKSE